MSALRDSQVVSKKAFTEKSESVLASCLAQIVQKHPDLARLIEAWPTLPKQHKTKIMELVEEHSNGRKADGKTSTD